MLLGGMVYDIFGRQLTLYWMILIMGFILVLPPIVAPNQTLYIICMSCFTLFAAPTGSAPLVQDYVIIEDMGKANALGLMGSSGGVVVSLQVLYSITAKIDPALAWGTCSIILILFALLSLFIVAEPVDKIESKPHCENIKYLIKQTCITFRVNKALSIGMILMALTSGSIVLFELYIMSWLIRFKDNGLT